MARFGSRVSSRGTPVLINKIFEERKENSENQEADLIRQNIFLDRIVQLPRSLAASYSIELTGEEEYRITHY